MKIIKRNNIRAKSFIDKDRNTFIKESKFNTEYIFNRYTNFHESIANINGLNTPKPLSIIDENFISFEYMDLGNSLKDIIEKSLPYKEGLFNQIGKKLGDLHFNINKGAINDTMKICGDFCSWNIHVDKEDIFFIDFEPPFRILNSQLNPKEYLDSNSYKGDIGQFIFRLKNILLPSKPHLFLKSFNKEIDDFLKGYFESTGVSLSLKDIKSTLRKIAKEEIQSEKNFNNKLFFIITKLIYKIKYKI